MADKELRHMSRMELIEIIYAVQQEEESLRRENEELKSQLADRTIRIEEAGSIAEAALSLNHVFEDAQNAADEYLLSVRESIEQILRERPDLAATLQDGKEREDDG